MGFLEWSWRCRNALNEKLLQIDVLSENNGDVERRMRTDGQS